MSGQNLRVGFFEGWINGLVEYVVGDSTRLDRQALGYVKNIRLDETGTISGRRGLAARATGVPNNRYMVDEFKSNSMHAVVGSDGKTISVLASTGWVTIGTFTNDGRRASYALMNQRGYFVNGIDRPKVIWWTGAAWTIRDAGVVAPTVAPVVVPAGGVAPALPYNNSYTYVDDRGFESNVSPFTIVNCNDGGTLTSTVAGPAPTNNAMINFYSSLRNQRDMYFVGSVAATGAGPFSLTYSARNIDRDENIPYPDQNNPPPSGIYSIMAHKNRLYGAQSTSGDSYYAFSKIGEPEYWPTGLLQDLGVSKDSSNVINFSTCSLGLMPFKETSTMLLEGDPESVTAPQPVLQGSGLVHPDGFVALNGVVFFVGQRGIIAHDGIRPIELWRKIKQSSDTAVNSSNVFGTYQDIRAHLMFKDANVSNAVKDLHFDIDKKRWLSDELQIAATATTDTDSLRDFSSEASVAEYENVENGAQSIATGGGTGSITLTGVNSAKLVTGTKITFSDLTECIVTNVVGATLSVVPNAPGAASVNIIRGTNIDSGSLTMTNYTIRELLIQRAWNRTYIGTFSTTVTLATQPRAGNLLIAIINCKSTWTSSAIAYPTPAVGGWTLISSDRGTLTGGTYGDQSVSMRMYAMTVPAGAALSYTFNSNDGHTELISAEVEEFEGAAMPSSTSSFTHGTIPTPGDMSSTNITTAGRSLTVYAIESDGGPGVSPPTNGFTQSAFEHSELGTTATYQRTVFGYIFADAGTRNTSYTLTDNEKRQMITMSAAFPVSSTSKYPIGNYYFTRTTPKSSFPSYAGFSATPIRFTNALQPANTDLRFGIRFVAAGSFMYWTGTDWQVLTDIAAQSMTSVLVESLTSAQLNGTNGFNPAIPYLEIMVYMRSSTLLSAPSLSGITIEFSQGSVVNMSWCNTFSKEVPIAGGSPLPEGTYVWNTSAGYRLEDGTTDDGRTITKEIITQKVIPDEHRTGVFKEIEVEIDSEVTTTVDVTPIVDNVVGVTKTITVGPNQKLYYCGIPRTAAGAYMQAKVTWTDNDLIIRSIGFTPEMSARTKA